MSASSGFEKAVPVPLGLYGIGLAAVVLGLGFAGRVPSPSLGIAYEISWAGLAQAFAGWLSIRRGDNFAGTVFTSYGMFWLALATAQILAMHGVLLLSHKEIGLWLVLYGIITLFYVVVAVMERAVVLSITGSLLTISLFLLGSGMMAGIEEVVVDGGYSTFITGVVAIYLSTAILVNVSLGRRILPE
jgi:succinate-acetate transporter protein